MVYIHSAVSDLAHVPLVLGVFHIEDGLRDLIRSPPLPIRRFQLVQIAKRSREAKTQGVMIGTPQRKAERSKQGGGGRSEGMKTKKELLVIW